MYHQGKNISDHILFDTLSQEEKKLLENDYENGSALPKEFLYENDKKLNHVYFIRKGAVLVGRNHGRPNEYGTQLILDAHFLGVETLLLSQNNEFAKTLSDVYFSKIGFDTFSYLIRRNLQFQDTVRKQMYTRLERLEVKYNLLHSNVNFIDRLKHFFVDLAKAGESNNGNEVTVNIQITHMEISRYLHCSRQSITTALSSLRQAGYIDYSRTSIKIIDLKKIIDWKLK